MKTGIDPAIRYTLMILCFDTALKPLGRLLRRLPAAAVFLLLSVLLISGCSRKEETVFTMAEKALGESDFETAYSYYSEALELGLETEKSLRGRGIALMSRGDYDGAVSDFEDALHSSHGIPSDIEFDINYYLAACFYKLGRFDEAIKVYDAITALRPSSADAFKMRGDAKLQVLMREEAVSDYNRAVQLEPKNYDRMILILQSLKDAGLEETGKGYLEETLDRYSSGMSNYDRGRLYYYLEQYDTAKTYLEQARASSSDYRSSSLLGQTYEKLGDYNYAVSVYESFIAADQSHPEVYNRLGLCRMAMGSYQEALNAFQQGLMLQDTAMDQSLTYNEIVAYEYLGQFKKAAVLMESYLQKYPTDEDARREYIFLSTR